MPRFSFVVLAYNQERFIREAVEGAFAQTYCPLEIILSDDASTDQTFAVMSELAANYRGPHSVRLNRNEVNLGVAGHYNRICQLASGQCLVVSAGDDVSQASRVKRIAEEWERAGRPAEAVFYSQVQRITKEGRTCAEEGVVVSCEQPADAARLLSEWGGFVVGASMAVTRGVLEKFGPLGEDVPCEDIPALWRGALCGHLLFIDEALVQWRVGGAGLWSSAYGREATPDWRLAKMKRFLRERQALVPQARSDARACGRAEALALALSRFEQETACALGCLDGSPWRFLGRYLLQWIRRGRVSHAMRECVVEHIRISKACGRNYGLWVLTEAAARLRRLLSSGRACCAL